MNRADSAQRLVLGTVQFGLAYGVANTSGRVPLQGVERILSLARDAGITTLDTAIAYGDSERVLGEFSLEGFDIISKLPISDDFAGDARSWVNREVEASLKRLGINRLSGLLLHRPEQLLREEGDSLYQALCALRSEGVVGGIGISIYGPETLAQLANRYEFDLVQSPYSVLDQRLHTSGWLERLGAGKVEVHARSVFLQGLLLMEQARRPASFDRWRALWRCWHEWLVAAELTPLQACLRFVMAEKRIPRVLVGVDSAAQLAEILSAVQGEIPPLPASLFTEDEELLNPSMWSGV